MKTFITKCKIISIQTYLFEKGKKRINIHASRIKPKYPTQLIVVLIFLQGYSY